MTDHNRLSLVAGDRSLNDMLTQGRIAWISLLLLGGILTAAGSSLWAQEELPSGTRDDIESRQEEALKRCQLPDVTPIWEISTDIRPRSIDEEGAIVDPPPDCSHYHLPDDVMFPVSNASGFQILYPRAATQFWHRPLYFQDVRLERLGLSAGCFEPTASGLYFFGNVVFLPFQMMSLPPKTCVPTPPAF